MDDNPIIVCCSFIGSALVSVALMYKTIAGAFQEMGNGDFAFELYGQSASPYLFLNF